MRSITLASVDTMTSKSSVTSLETNIARASFQLYFEEKPKLFLNRTNAFLHILCQIYSTAKNRMGLFLEKDYSEKGTILRAQLFLENEYIFLEQDLS